MASYEEWKKISLIVHVYILPIFGLVAIILDAISTFTNLSLFRSRPTYEYSLEPDDPKDGHVYVLSLDDCKTNFTESLVSFVNDLHTPYYTFTVVICFIFSFISFIITHFVHFCEHFYEEYHQYLKKLNRYSIISSSLSFMFSVPAMYAIKIEFKDCFVIDGILKSFANSDWELFCNFGLWSIFGLPLIICCCILFKKDDDLFNNDCFKWVFYIMAGCILLYVFMAFSTKVGYVIALKIGWDISVTLNLVTGSVAIWFNCWKIAQVDVDRQPRNQA